MLVRRAGICKGGIDAMKTINTYEVKIYIAGDLSAIINCCRIFCLRGACVSVQQMDFVYTGGMESGACVGLINNARFPRKAVEIDSLAIELANQLIGACCQRSCSVSTPEKTYYIENVGIKIPL